MIKETVLITGASGGIGYEMVKLFAREKYNLVLVARNQGKLEAIRLELAHLNIDITVIPKDLTQPGAVDALYHQLASHNIRIHVLVNNAGVGSFGNLHEHSLEQIVQTMNLNMVALTQLTYLFAADMRKQRYGRIVNVASISSFVPTPMMSVYAATKAYVLSLSESLNSELRAEGDISVTAICPGFTDTDFIRRTNMARLETMLERIAIPPAKVAMAGYQAIQKKKPIMVVGGLYSTMYALTRALPREWLQRATRAAASFGRRDLNVPIPIRD